jgi:TonB family protein
MTSATMHLDLESYRRRTRWSMGTSTAVHALILLWIVLAPRVAPQTPTLTEITLIEPGDLAPAAAPAAPAPSARRSDGAAAASPADQSFRRLTSPAELTPEPESPTALEDRLAARLASLREAEPTPVRGVPASALGTAWGTPATVGTGVGGKGSTPLALNRGDGGTGSAQALPLSRGSGTALGPAIVPTGLPSSAATPAGTSRGGDAAARRALAGAMLAGPIRDRPVVSYVRPVYPEWAKRDAVEGSVTLYFVVGPDGGVRENVLVQKTAGFEDFDESARTALRMWRFAALREGRTGEQWGTITFHFRLREAG